MSIARVLGWSVVVAVAALAAGSPRANGDEKKKPTSPGRGAGILVDHRCLALEKIPAAALARAREDLRLGYGHTSHGSQVVSGMRALDDPKFAFGPRARAGSLLLVEWGGDLGLNGDLTWATRTRERLAGPDADKNVVVWSWCGGCGAATEANIRAYLDEMRALEKEYPKVTFVRMTGHLVGQGARSVLHERNEQIRKDCKETGAPLFDFADIESFDPDGNAFLEKGASDDCSYRKPDGTRGNWAEEWVARHPDHGWRLPPNAAHTHPLNGAMKGRAFWWLLARLAGWDGK